MSVGLGLQDGFGEKWDDAIPGTRRFFTADPWGNRIELVAAIGRPG